MNEHFSEQQKVSSVTNYEKIFLESFHRLTQTEAIEARFLDEFYQSFMAASPEVRKRFEKTDFEKQKKVLKSSLYQILALYTNKIVDAHFEKIVKSHSKSELDIYPYLYEIWLTCLINTVKRNDLAFSSEVELAWRMVMALGITYMKFKYDK